jgi:hypothetical protein
MTATSRDKLYTKYGMELKEMTMEKMTADLRDYERIIKAEAEHKKGGKDEKAMVAEIGGISFQKPPLNEENGGGGQRQH